MISQVFTDICLLRLNSSCIIFHFRKYSGFSAHEHQCKYLVQASKLNNFFQDNHFPSVKIEYLNNPASTAISAK
jgi:hypothetical protein